MRSAPVHATRGERLGSGRVGPAAVPLATAVRRACGLAALCAGAWAAPAAAQSDAPADAAGAVLEEVVVTAQKREQRLIDVPVSVSAITATDLERGGITEFVDYARRVPNVGFTQQGNRAFTKIAIRGVTNIGGRANSVGVYVDEFNVAPNILVNGYSRTLDTSLYEVERVEVLRGPQGTYFGRNTLGGAISITTRRPEPGRVGGDLRYDMDELDGWLARGSLNLGYSDESAISLAVYRAKQGAWIDNVGPSDADNEGTDSGGRIAFHTSPGDALEVDLSYAYSQTKTDFPAFVPSGRLSSIPTQLVQIVTAWPLLWRPLPVPPISTTGFPDWPLPTDSVPFSPGNLDRHSTDLPFASDSQTHTAIARVNYEFSDSLRLTSVSGATRNDFDMFGDGDMSPYPAFTVSRRSRSDAWSQELRLQSSGERFDWMVGAIYARDEITETDVSTHLATDPYLRGWGALLFALGAQSGQINPAQQPFLGLLTSGQVPAVFGPQTVGNFEDVDRDTETRSAAVFADATWHLTPRLDLSAGLRYTDDTVEVREVTRRTITIPTGSDRDEGGFDDVSPRVALSFRPVDGMQVYASAAKGYKVGGFNSTATTALPAIQKRFGEETAWNYEVGYKGLFAGDRVQLTAAVFWFDWKDLQVRGQDVLTQRQFVQNAADAESKGGELEVTARPAEWLTLRASYGYVDATFGRFTNAVSTAGTVFDATGNRIPYAPENTYSASVDVDVPLGESRGYLRADWTYVDDQFFDAENSQARLIPAYDVLDLRVGITRGAWDFSLFLKNALDEEYILGNQNLETFYSGDQVAVGQPRTFGGSVKFRF